MRVIEDKRGRNFVMIMIVIAICALFLKVFIEQIIKINIVQNESNAQVTLKLISASLENYAKDHKGIFPADLSILIQNNPPYLDQDYVAKSPIKGYDYNCSRIDTFGYNCSASPVKCRLTGKIIYTVTTGGLLISEDCSKKE